MNIELPDQYLNDIVESAGFRAAQFAEDRIKASIDKAVANMIDARCGAIASEIIAAQVEAVIEAGWQKTDEYGNPRGNKATVRDRIEAYLTEKRGDYGNKESLIDRVLKERVSNLLDKEFSQIISEAKARFRAQVDGVLTAKLAEVLREGLGLR